MPFVPEDSGNIIVGDPGVTAVGNRGTATVSDRDSTTSQTIIFYRIQVLQVLVRYMAQIFFLLETN